MSRDTFASRAGVCRDYAHLLVALARAGEIPARFHFSGAPLPRLGTGKIDRVAIKAQHRN